MSNIPVFKPLLEKEEISSAVEALKMGWLGMGSYVGKFEKELEKYLEIENKYIAAVSTGHAALHLALLVAGIKPGDEVITPSFNNIADFQAILAVGAKPVFCDILKDTLCIDLDKAEDLITEKTKAMIAVDYGCMLANHQKVKSLAEKHNIRVIHDAAHSFGSKYYGKKIGSFSDICMFSFDPVKTITTIDGGIIVVNTEEEHVEIKERRLIGMGQPSNVMYQNKRAWTYDVKKLGFRYHMANLHAAIGLSQLSKIKAISETRLKTCLFYNERLEKIIEIQTPQTNFEGIVPFLYYILVPKERRNSFIEFMKDNGIDTGIHWQPGHWFSLLKDCKKGDLSVTEKIGNEIVTLPLHSCMSKKDINKIISIVEKFFTN